MKFIAFKDCLEETYIVIVQSNLDEMMESEQNENVSSACSAGEKNLINLPSWPEKTYIQATKY